jgi:hypothetical protein
MSRATRRNRRRDEACVDESRAKQACRQDRHAEAASWRRHEAPSASPADLLDELAAPGDRRDADEIDLDGFEHPEHELPARLDV